MGLDPLQTQLEQHLATYEQPVQLDRWRITIDWKVRSRSGELAAQQEVWSRFFGDGSVRALAEERPEDCPVPLSGVDGRGCFLLGDADPFDSVVEWLNPQLWIALNGPRAAEVLGEKLPYFGDFFQKPTLADHCMKRAGGDRILVSFHDGSPWLLAYLPENCGSFRREANP